MSDFKPVVVDGERYEATVPDTLDLADRAALAINGLGGTLDPEDAYLQYFMVCFRAQPPYMQHWGSCDHTCTPKYAESFPMVRAMCGSEQHLDTEQEMMKALLADISPEDGQYYIYHRPNALWHRHDRRWFDRTQEAEQVEPEDFSQLVGTARMLRAILTWHERDEDPGWLDRMQSMARGLGEIAVHRDDYAYYPEGGLPDVESFSYPRRTGWRSTEEPTDEYGSVEGSVVAYFGHQIQALARWYAVSGDEQALDLARKITNFVTKPKFWGGLGDVPTIAGSQYGHFDSHFHARAVAIRGVLQYAIEANDVRLLEFVRGFYEYQRTMGIPRMGWYLSYPRANREFMEGCSLGDLVALTIRLSDAGIGDYWDDADQIIRNHLVEGQLVRADLLEKVAQSGPERPMGSNWIMCYRGYERQHVFPGQETTENVIRRCLGNYAGFSTPTSLPNTWVMQCCTGNGTQGLYYAWEGIVRFADGRAQVNLLLNRASPWLDIDSYLPYQGRVVVRNRTASSVSVRIPAWVNRRSLRCRVNDEDRRTSWTGNYLEFGGLAPGDAISLDFPVVETTHQYTTLSRTDKEQVYSCTFRGNTLVDISPRDESPSSYPLYLREHLKRDSAPMKTTTRYVAPKPLLRW